MGFAEESGFIPTTVPDIIDGLMAGINEQFGTTYTTETFIGTNFYKYFYALAARIEENEIKTAEIFAKLQDYFAYTNETIIHPKVTPNGLIDTFALLDYDSSVKPMEDAEAGELSICVDVDEDAVDYDAQKLAICTVIKDNTCAGVITNGDQTETLVLTNGQSFDFSYFLPTRTEIQLRLTTILSRNNETVIATPEETKEKLLANIAARYKLGKDFEPLKYFSVQADAPWCSEVLLEYDSGGGWTTDTFEADFDELYVILLENIELVEE